MTAGIAAGEAAADTRSVDDCTSGEVEGCDDVGTLPVAAAAADADVDDDDDVRCRAAGALSSCRGGSATESSPSQNCSCASDREPPSTGSGVVAVAAVAARADEIAAAIAELVLVMDDARERGADVDFAATVGVVDAAEDDCGNGGDTDVAGGAVADEGATASGGAVSALDVVVVVVADVADVAAVVAVAAVAAIAAVVAGSGIDGTVAADDCVEAGSQSVASPSLSNTTSSSSACVWSSATSSMARDEGGDRTTALAVVTAPTVSETAVVAADAVGEASTVGDSGAETTSMAGTAAPAGAAPTADDAIASLSGAETASTGECVWDEDAGGSGGDGGNCDVAAVPTVGVVDRDEGRLTAVAVEGADTAVTSLGVAGMTNVSSVLA